ncbi:MAG: radical SAM protein [Desulfobacteraceae bacterium]|nr:radical SAM protein [Desulfobacteraceae bacterium]
MLPKKPSTCSESTEKSEKPFIIPIFIPHAGCAHRCAFCNQTTITGTTAPIPSDTDTRSRIEEFLSYKTADRGNVEIAFYGGNFLGLPPHDILRLLSEAQRYIDDGNASTIRFSTRPDTITRQRLDLLKNFSVSVIEIGAQSMSDEVLKLSLRGHTAEDTRKAAELVKQSGYRLGLQMMIGLPGDNQERIMDSGAQIARLGPEFVRIYPTVVIKGSLLAKWYAQGTYQPLPLKDAISCVRHLYLLFRDHHITVIRMGLQASADLEPEAGIVAGPYHPAFGHLVMSEIFLDKTIAIMVSANITGKEAAVRVHPNSISQFRGEKNGNIDILRNMFGYAAIRIIPDASLCREDVTIQTEGRISDGKGNSYDQCQC